MARTPQKVKATMSEKNIREAMGYTAKTPVSPVIFSRVRKAVWLDEFAITKGEAQYYLGHGDDWFYCSLKRGDCVAVREALVDRFQRHISLVRKDLDNEWGRSVRERDGNQCTQCGAVKNLTAHHWCRNAQRSRAARWCLDNGVTLCYACHIRFAHERPDWLLYDSYRRHVVATTGRDTARVTDNIEVISGLTLDDKTIRRTWYDWGLHDVNGKYAVMAEREGNDGA